MAALQKKKKTKWLVPVALGTTLLGALAWAFSATDTGTQFIDKAKDYVNQKLHIKDFYKQFFPYAQESERTTAVPALVTLAQAALESGWGAHAPGFNFFGLKVKGKVPWTGKQQLLRTTEYAPQGAAFPIVESIETTDRKNSKGQRLFKYVVKDWFRAYDSPAASFIDKAQWLRSNDRYKPAFDHTDPYKFATAVAKAGYATDPDYEKKLHKLIYNFQEQ